MRQLLSGLEIVEFVLRHVHGLGRRPTIAETAAAMGLSTVQLRRLLHRYANTSFRVILTEVCLTQAASLIRNGTKIAAAMRLAGFRNKTNFNRQFVRRFGTLPSHFRHIGYVSPRMEDCDVLTLLLHLAAARQNGALWSG